MIFVRVLLPEILDSILLSCLSRSEYGYYITIYVTLCRSHGYDVQMSGREIWPFLFLLGLLFFNWPFLEIFSLSLPYYLFGIWAVFIAGLRIIMTVVSRRGD